MMRQSRFISDRLLSRNGLCVGLFAALLLCSFRPACGTLVLSYLADGANDPVSEGWTLSSAQGGTTFGGGMEGDGTKYWFVDDTSNADSSFAVYQQTVSEANVSSASAVGWRLSTTIRVPTTGNLNFSTAPFVAYDDGASFWWLGFEVVNGNVVIKAITTATVTFTGGLSSPEIPDSSTYLNVDLQYDPVSGDADVFVNDVEVISNYGGNSFGSTPSVQWGASSLFDPDVGRGNFNSVSFSIQGVPEPSAFLFGLIVLPGVVYALWKTRQTGDSSARKP